MSELQVEEAQMMIVNLLKVPFDKGGDALIIKPNETPKLSKAGELSAASDTVLDEANTTALISCLFDEDVKAKLESQKEVSFDFSLSDYGRLEITAKRNEASHLSAVISVIWRE